MIKDDMRMFTYRGLWLRATLIPDDAAPPRIWVTGCARSSNNRRSRAPAASATPSLAMTERTYTSAEKKTLIDLWWRDGLVVTTGCYSADHVPWELHEIDDPVARNAAYSAWRKEARL